MKPNGKYAHENSSPATWTDIFRTKVLIVWLALVVVALLLIGLGWFLLPPPTERVAAPPPSSSPPSSAPPSAEKCTTARGEIEPVRFQVDRLNLDAPVLTVGKDAQGNPGAPPQHEGETIGWYQHSPAPGADKGNVILTAHTYSEGLALGNVLYGRDAGTEGLQAGDVIKLYNSAGERVCYRYSKNDKIWADSYDPKSGVFHNLRGPAQLAIMVCWDYMVDTKEWDSRVIFYAPKI